MRIIAVAIAMTIAGPASAAAAETAPQRIETFYDGVLGIMKAAKTLGPSGRNSKFAPLVARTYDMATLTRVATGPRWASLSAADQAALTAALTRYTTANYAKNFDGFAGEKFVVDPAPVPRGGDVIVKSRIVPGSGTPVEIAYRMHQGAGGWRVTDVFYAGGVSELGLRRAEFGAVLARGGAAELIRTLDTKTAGLLR